MTGAPPYPYRVTYSYTGARPPSTRITTSRTELFQIAVAFLVLTLDFSIILGVSSFLGIVLGLSILSPVVIGVAAAASLTAFVAHEMAHKIAAQRFGAWAEFRYAPMMLLLSVVMSFAVGFLFAAPGATVVSGMTDPREWGRTSLAGPLANLGFAVAFLAAAVGTVSLGIAVFGPLLLLMFFNAWFGAFNLIPFGPLDGAKVFRWSKPVWLGALAAAALLTIYAYAATLYNTPLPFR